MAFLNFNEEQAKSTSGGVFTPLETGVYDAVIDTASKTVASTGTIGIDWSFEIDGTKYMVYGMWVQKADGTPIFNMDIVQNLMGILGVKELTEYDKTIEVRDGKKVVKAFKELDGKRIKVAIQKVKDWYNGEERVKYEIKNFFDADTGKTYAELVSNSDAKQIKWYEESMKDKETDAFKKAKFEDDEPEEDDGDSIL